MDVDGNVELFRAGDRCHFCCKSEVVGLVLEERIRHHLDLVKVYPLVPSIKAHRHDRRDKMHIMPALSQLLPKFGPDDPAAAVRWINCYSNIH